MVQNQALGRFCFIKVFPQLLLASFFGFNHQNTRAYFYCWVVEQDYKNLKCSVWIGFCCTFKLSPLAQFSTTVLAVTPSQPIWLMLLSKGFYSWARIQPKAPKLSTLRILLKSPTMSFWSSLYCSYWNYWNIIAIGLAKIFDYRIIFGPGHKGFLVHNWKCCQWTGGWVSRKWKKL